MCFPSLTNKAVLASSLFAILSENLRKAVGFRNIAVHEYYKIDWEIVFTIISNSLDDFRKFAAVVMSIADTSPLT